MRYKYNIDFFKTQSRDLGYFLGFLTADGYCKNKYVKFQLNTKDDSVLKYFVDLISPNHKLTYYTRMTKNTICNVVDFCIGSKKIVEILKKDFDIESPKTYNLKLPNNLNIKFYPDFIRGFFDGDGSVSILRSKLRSRICSVSDTFLNILNQYLGFGKIVKSNQMFELSFNESESFKLKTIIYNNEPFSLLRKKNVFYSISDHYNNIVIRRNIKPFNDYEINIIKNNYDKQNSYHSMINLSKILDRSLKSIDGKIRRLILKGIIK